MGRADSVARLAWAYGVHLARRRLKQPRSQLAHLLETYRTDGIRPLESAERERHPTLVSCINCGLCAYATGRMGKTRLPDLATSYMRLYARLAEASSDIGGDSNESTPDFALASAVCPVGLPLEEVAAVARRLATG